MNFRLSFTLGFLLPNSEHIRGNLSSGRGGARGIEDPPRRDSRSARALQGRAAGHGGRAHRETKCTNSQFSSRLRSKDPWRQASFSILRPRTGRKTSALKPAARLPPGVMRLGTDALPESLRKANRTTKTNLPADAVECQPYNGIGAWRRRRLLQSDSAVNLFFFPNSVLSFVS